MKTLRNNTGRLLFFASTVLFLISCSEEEERDETIPVIANLELGMENSKQFFQGEELHLEFEASDNEELGRYQVHIHAEEKSSAAAWEVEQSWNFDPGLKNALVHQDEILVPLDADPGIYHFHLMLVDKAGNTTSVEEEIEVIATK